MSIASTATDLLRSLSTDDIRRRLADLDAEQRALRTLLRAAVRLERVNNQTLVGQAEEQTKKAPGQY